MILQVFDRVVALLLRRTYVHTFRRYSKRNTKTSSLCYKVLLLLFNRLPSTTLTLTLYRLAGSCHLAGNATTLAGGNVAKSFCVQSSRGEIRREGGMKNKTSGFYPLIISNTP